MPRVGQRVELIRSITKPTYKRNFILRVCSLNDRLVRAFSWRMYGSRSMSAEHGRDRDGQQKQGNSLGMKMFYLELNSALDSTSRLIFKKRIIVLMVAT